MLFHIEDYQNHIHYYWIFENTDCVKILISNSKFIFNMMAQNKVENLFPTTLSLSYLIKIHIKNVIIRINNEVVITCILRKIYKIHYVQMCLNSDLTSTSDLCLNLH